mmetsp:Transcript_26275/g.48875  ORF Transcript_26275/g.48875 Transcript_26275/m.48875 type:complete len:212 (-) Transcript_26275:285-920(-)|eukprot:CAMPEP_0197459754 /NCGR_PEP_ID=MMETSP1175-20131217/52292_1 /TAXON_ID=1003142 /ORGANISM="Triceratium dubium, Strain CCMP147" /LENGTH=211 /DNA_ID=CAMNT_0042994715 /DNA_START=393 /DNA_END=1028 /DNA_ORIENTATION=-
MKNAKQSTSLRFLATKVAVAAFLAITPTLNATEVRCFDVKVTSGDRSLTNDQLCEVFQECSVDIFVTGTQCDIDYSGIRNRGLLRSIPEDLGQLAAEEEGHRRLQGCNCGGCCECPGGCGCYKECCGNPFFCSDRRILVGEDGVPGNFEDDAMEPSEDRMLKQCDSGDSDLGNLMKMGCVKSEAARMMRKSKDTKYKDISMTIFEEGPASL